MKHCHIKITQHEEASVYLTMCSVTFAGVYTIDYK